MKPTPIVNIYNFIRMSHVEPSVFIPDDFETVRNQMTLIRQYGLPATYALKYDALMEPRYQELLQTYTGDEDEISAWWEITAPLCQKAGVAFRGIHGEEYDDRVDSAYSIGYTPDERRKLVDAYMSDFYGVFGFYPKTIGSWVLDTATIDYAAEKYGILGSAICRDQMGTDGFTLWGGFPNGIYYPSCSNENIPANTYEGQLKVPMFRLLGPDPIYNFEQDVRDGLHGVYTLEPSWLIGRNKKWISWFFGCLTEEDTLGAGYAHVGQENNFLWENIKPGMEPQLKKIKSLLADGKIRVETMAASASWFERTYRLTPPTTFQASKDWDADRNLSAQWYACSNYRLGFLGEKGHLRIRDFFLYRQEYPSRYLKAPMHSTKSTFDALPILFPQLWISQRGQRPFIRLLDKNGQEPCGVICYQTLDELTAQAKLCEEKSGQQLACFTLSPDCVVLEGNYHLYFDTLSVFRSCTGRKISLEHEGFFYDFEIEKGNILRAGTDGVEVSPEDSKICLRLGHAIEKNAIFADAETAPTSVQVEKECLFQNISQVLSSDYTCDGLTRNELAQNGLAQNKLAQDKPAQNEFAQNRLTQNGLAQNESTQNELVQNELTQKIKETAQPPVSKSTKKGFPVPPMAPSMEPESCIFPVGTTAQVLIKTAEPGEIHYTLDGSEPTTASPRYTYPLELKSDVVLSARLFLPDGRFSDISAAKYNFGIKGIRLTSTTHFDPRPVFRGNGISDLLDPRRGSLDYLDGRWRGTLEDLEVCGQLPELLSVEKITMGFLSHHRSGIIYPEALELYTGLDLEHLTLTAQLQLPCQPCAREIACQDFSLPVGKEIGAFRLVAHRYAKMPQWCCYRGSTSVFTMTDNIILHTA